MECRQLLILPRSWHFGQIQNMSSFTGSIQAAISIWQGFLFGLRLHLTMYSGGYSISGCESMNTIAAKYSARIFAGAGSEIKHPSSSRK